MVSIHGKLAPLPTPFTDDLSGVSEVRLARLVRAIAPRVAGFVVCSNAGEFTTLSFGERKQVVEFVVREAHGMPVVVHVSSLSTAASLDLAQHAVRHGVAACLLMPPYFGHFNGDEIREHLVTIARFAQGPIWMLDPDHRIGQEALDGLHDLPGVTFVDGPSSDELGHGGVEVHPMFAMPESVMAEADLWTREASAAILKTAWEMADLDLGPCRAPRRMLTPEARTSLRGV